jgi:hypothetical protein
MRRQIVWFGLMVALLAALLVACGQPGRESPAANPESHSASSAAVAAVNAARTQQLKSMLQSRAFEAQKERLAQVMRNPLQGLNQLRELAQKQQAGTTGTLSGSTPNFWERFTKNESLLKKSSGANTDSWRSWTDQIIEKYGRTQHTTDQSSIN